MKETITQFSKILTAITRHTKHQRLESIDCRLFQNCLWSEIKDKFFQIMNEELDHVDDENLKATCLRLKSKLECISFEDWSNHKNQDEPQICRLFDYLEGWIRNNKGHDRKLNRQDCIVQDKATAWIQGYPAPQKSAEETKKAIQ